MNTIPSERSSRTGLGPSAGARRSSTRAAPPRRSKLISLLGGWMLVRGAFGLALVALMVATIGNGEPSADSGTGAGWALLLGLLFVPAGLNLVVGAGLLSRRRWGYYLLILLWALEAALSVAQLVFGMAGPSVPGAATGLGGLAIGGAIQLLMIYWLMSHRHEFR